MNEIELARVKRRAEKRLRALGVTKKLAEAAVGRMRHDKLLWLGQQSLKTNLRGQQ